MKSRETNAFTWVRWEQSFESSLQYENPCADIELMVNYYSPDGQVTSSYGFWDGGNNFKICFAFPVPGVWTWETQCSDIYNPGLHGKSGEVTVDEYKDSNMLYRYGFLKNSVDGRYLVHNNETPFLWMGDTAWVAPLNASFEDWVFYIDDRVSKKFTVIQISPASIWSGSIADIEGNTPFIGENITMLNPPYWKGFEKKIQYANDQGLVVMIVGLMEPVSRYPEFYQAEIFSKNLVARLFGNFVIFSPSFDSSYRELGNEVGLVLRKLTKIHLITQHPNTPWQKSTNETAEGYYTMNYLDFSANQSGHNNGDVSRCMKNAVEWNLSLYSKNHNKPVINTEAYYDSNGTTEGLGQKFQGTAFDARALGYLSWLSGSLGYTYGAYGLWNWQTDIHEEFYWRKAINYPSSIQMKHLHDFFASIEWWKLEPAHHLIENQQQDYTKVMALARDVAGKQAVAYLPGNDCIQINMRDFPYPMSTKWYNPEDGNYIPGECNVSTTETHSFNIPSQRDWILYLYAGS